MSEELQVNRLGVLSWLCGSMCVCQAKQWFVLVSVVVSRSSRSLAFQTPPLFPALNHPPAAPPACSHHRQLTPSGVCLWALLLRQLCPASPFTTQSYVPLLPQNHHTQWSVQVGDTQC